MIYVYAIVEGVCEERFIKEILVPYFSSKNIFLTAERVITGRDSKDKFCKGGGRKYSHYKNHLKIRSQEFNKRDSCYFTTMIDLYAIPSDFPGFSKMDNFQDKYKMVQFLEESFFNDIGIENFIPYIQMHEFESLILCDLERIKDEFLEIHLDVSKIQKELSKYHNIELINDKNPPSKRINELTNGLYCDNKIASSINILKNIDLALIRAKLKHFNEWIEKIESLKNGDFKYL